MIKSQLARFEGRVLSRERPVTDAVSEHVMSTRGQQVVLVSLSRTGKGGTKE